MQFHPDNIIDNHFLSNEYIITNGIGGYASSSVSGANTRRYHGLLVASLQPPTDRRILVAKVEERIVHKGQYIDLSTNLYPDTVHPKGYEFLKSFERSPLPKWEYRSDEWSLQKELFMVEGSNTTVLQYTNTGTSEMILEVHPLLVNKDYHAIFSENERYDFYYEKQPKALKIHAQHGSEPFYMIADSATFVEERSWYKNIQLFRDHYRGQQHVEDYYRIGYYSLTIPVGKTVSILFSTDATAVDWDVTLLKKKTLNSIKSIQNKNIKDTFYNDLLVAADQFIVKRASTDSYTILAGYHWFTDWGRDTMIAMRGLTIATGKKEVSKSILSTFLKYIDKGMMPNRFPDYAGQEIEYNTIDATLWLFVALYDYCQKFEDKKFIQKHMPDLEGIIQAHISGTRYGIHVTEEGFLSGGEEGVQLTWMDAIAEGHVMTPRMGCPVEINALWYNALCIYHYFEEETKYKSKVSFKKYEKLLASNFASYFLNSEGYLNDVVIPKISTDTSFRPNQLYVLSLPFRLLTSGQEKKIIQLASEKIVTPLGLRTLSPDHSEFKPNYKGNKWKRDQAYHQGTVWPFLIPEYYEAYLRLHKYSDKAKKQVKKDLEPLRVHFYESDCIHGISEIFDGLHPKEGRGTIHQAWSISALIKLYTEHRLYEV